MKQSSLLLIGPVLALWLGCSATKSVEPTPGVNATDRTQEGSEQARYGGVDATILFTDCPKVSNYSATLAEKTMRRLVEACNEVPGGQATFIATLQPAGHIELSPVEGTTGTVPFCVLKHSLTHQVSVRQACKMEVQIEQRR